MGVSMGITTAPTSLPRTLSRSNSAANSMSQGYHQSIFGFSDGFDRTNTNQEQQQQQQQHIAQQSRRDKLRVQGFDAAGNPTLIPIHHEDDQEAGIYPSQTMVNSNNMLSDMFNFAAGPSATELLAGQISGSAYRVPPRQSPISGFSADWYGSNRPELLLSNSPALSTIDESAMKTASMNPDPAAAMQLFLMNPAVPRSPSPSPSAHHHNPQAFHSFAAGTSFGGAGGVEGQALSLTLSSSLQQYDMSKVENVGGSQGLLYFNNHSQPQQADNSIHLQGQGQVQARPTIDTGGSYGGIGMVNILRNSKYTRPAQELLEEFCSVGRGKVKGSRIGRSAAPNPNPDNSSSVGGGASSTAAASSSKDVPPLSPADRFEYQRKKAKLISMLDEVDRRYNHYCDQMQMVVNSFDSVMGFGAATPYTALAQRAMSRHFRCLKDAIATQLKQTCELLGEKDGASSSGITKGDTPRLRALDQSLRQQRAFHQMGMMDQEAWRPQRGLPERSVSLLRAWLFEHFLNPYPSDADKHLLARQTGLSRNQVSNWFINARVRLWKPMIEEMYQQEFKDDSDEPSEGNNQRPPSPTQQQQQVLMHQQHQQVQRNETNAPPNEMNPSTSSSSRHHHQAPPGMVMAGVSGVASDDNVLIGIDALADPQAEMYRYGTATTMRFGAPAGDISLTLGLRHTGGNAPAEKDRFSVRDFGG